MDTARDCTSCSLKNLQIFRVTVFVASVKYDGSDSGAPLYGAVVFE